MIPNDGEGMELFFPHSNRPLVDGTGNTLKLLFFIQNFRGYAAFGEKHGSVLAFPR